MVASRLGAGLKSLSAQPGKPGWARRAAPHLPVAILIVAYFAWFAQLSVAVQDGYGTPGYDMGIFDQGVWLLSRFHAPFVTVMGRNLFGDHTSFILLLAVPLYWVWPHAQTLLVLQSALIAGAAVPVYLLARRWTGSTVLATALAGAYLLNPALQNGNLEQFHPEAFLVLAIAVAIYAAVERKAVLLGVAVAACLLVKEDSALLVVPLGVWVFFRRDRAWGSRIVVASLAWMAFAYYVVIDTILGTVSFYANRIPFGGIAGLASAPFAHPGRFWGYFRGGGRPFYLWQTGVPFAWAFLISPEIAAIAVLTFAENYLSNFPYMHQILYHYSLSVVPVLAIGTAFALGRLATSWRRQVATVAVSVAALCSCVLLGLAPFSTHGYPHLNPSGAKVLAINEALEAVPPHAVVSAYYPYVAYLDHRLRIYQWPTPFRAQYWGLYRQEGRRLPFAGQVQYVVLPTDLTGVDASVFGAIAGRFRVVAKGGGVAVYRRVAPAPATGPGGAGRGAASAPRT
ncbi:MAG: DUF2079 domain-containing protein [Acidimicrobiales bacterium]